MPRAGQAFKTVAISAMTHLQKISSSQLGKTCPKLLEQSKAAGLLSHLLHQCIVRAIVFFLLILTCFRNVTHVQ